MLCVPYSGQEGPLSIQTESEVEYSLLLRPNTVVEWSAAQTAQNADASNIQYWMHTLPTYKFEHTQHLGSKFPDAAILYNISCNTSKHWNDNHLIALTVQYSNICNKYKSSE